MDAISLVRRDGYFDLHGTSQRVHRHRGTIAHYRYSCAFVSIRGKCSLPPQGRAYWTSGYDYTYDFVVNAGVSIDPALFVRTIQPLLQAKDAPALAATLRCRWTGDQITELLGSDDADAPKVAALALALVGGRCCIDALVRQLRHPDLMVNQMAEHALWSIWFRLGKPQANHHLCRGTQALNRSEYRHANEHFTAALDIDPTFSEAFNQRAIAHYLQEDYDESLYDCRRATELMPCHFGAWAGMGHCHAHMGATRKAIAAYERALDINPRLDCVREAVGELRRCPGC